MNFVQSQPDEVEMDLHGYHPDDICGEPLTKIIRQAWEMGAQSIRLIHGHGRTRGKVLYFVNTNTGYLGLTVRRKLRHDNELRRWIGNPAVATRGVFYFAASVGDLIFQWRGAAVGTMVDVEAFG
jgi:hypothetical protein